MTQTIKDEIERLEEYFQSSAITSTPHYISRAARKHLKLLKALESGTAMVITFPDDEEKKTMSEITLQMIDIIKQEAPTWSFDDE